MKLTLTLILIALVAFAGCASKAKELKATYSCVTPIGPVQLENDANTKVERIGQEIHGEREGEHIFIPFVNCVLILQPKRSVE